MKTAELWLKCILILHLHYVVGGSHNSFISSLFIILKTCFDYTYPSPSFLSVLRQLSTVFVALWFRLQWICALPTDFRIWISQIRWMLIVDVDADDDDGRQTEIIQTHGKEIWKKIRRLINLKSWIELLTEFVNIICVTISSADIEV